MGQYRFAIPASERFSNDALMASQIVGLDGIPWPCKTLLQQDVLLITRNTQLSGRLLVPFETRDFGEITLTTGTLPEVEDRIYLLDLELARGSLSRLRNQVSIWKEGGLKITGDFDERLANVINEYSNAIFLKNDEARRIGICESVRDQAVSLIFEVTREFSRQIAEIHASQQNHVPVIAGGVIDGSQADTPDAALRLLAVQRMSQPEVNDEGETQSYDFAKIDSVVDWLQDPSSRSVRIVGPLLQFDNNQLPPWIPANGSFEERSAAVRNFCVRFGNEYQKRIKILHVASGISGVGHQNFNYPQQLQLTLEMLESLDQIMPNTSMMVSFDQPWGERLSMATGGLPPMEIAEQLLRYGARISAFGLEFNLNYWPQGTLRRDPLQWVDLIDRWSQFGLPLAIYLSAPSGKLESATTSRFLQTVQGTYDAEVQEYYLNTIFNLLVRRPAVNVVAWRRTSDADNIRFPLSGLLDEAGVHKPAFAQFSGLVSEINRDQPASDDTLPA